MLRFWERTWLIKVTVYSKRLRSSLAELLSVEFINEMICDLYVETYKVDFTDISDNDQEQFEDEFSRDFLKSLDSSKKTWLTVNMLSLMMITMWIKNYILLKRAW